MAGKHLWERTDTESGLEHELFRTYLTMPRTERTYVAAWRASGRGAEGEFPPGSFYELVKEHCWEERTRAFDAYQDRLVERSLRDRRLKALIETADLGQALRRKAAEAAAMLEAGTTLNPDQIARLAKVGSELEMLALGLSSTRSEVVSTERDQAAIALDSVKDELKKRLEQIRSRQRDAEAILPPYSDCGG